MKKRILICVLALLCVATLVLAACDKTHTITVVAEDGSKTQLTVKHGEKAASVLDENTTYFTDEGCTKPFDPNTVIKDDITLYVNKSVCIVTFETNGGTAINSVRVNKGGTLPSNVVTTKHNYAFAGWYTDSGLNNKFEDGTAIEQSMTLYAKWTRTHYAVTLKVFLQEKVVDVAIGDSLALDGLLGKLGFHYDDYVFTFTGWADEAGNNYAPDGVIVVNGDMTLIGQFESSDVIFRLDESGEYYILETILNTEWTSFEIPSLYNGLPVAYIESLGPGPALKEVVIPDSVVGIESLGSSPALKNVYIPDSVEMIGLGAFANLSGLESINAPFLGAVLCDHLPANTPDDWVGLEGMFGAWFNMSDGYYRSGYYTVHSKFNALYEYDGEEVIAQMEAYFEYPRTLKHVTVRNGVIAPLAFYNATTIETVTLGDGVTGIGSYAFANDLLVENLPHNFTRLEINQDSPSFTTFSKNSFRDNCSLEYVTIPNRVTVLPAELFYNCLKLTTVDIDEDNSQLIEIEQEAFYIANTSVTASLSFINLPLKLQTIGMLAFANHTALKSIQFPASVKKIDGAAFRFATALTTVKFAPGNTMTELESSVFNGCGSLTSVTLPNTMKKIGSQAFCGCYSLGQFNFDGIEEIGSQAFADTDLQTVVLPSSVVKLGGSAFALCDNLTSFTFDCAYNNNISLNGMFDNCLNLSYVKLPNGIEVIGDSMFKNCQSLKSIVVPASVRVIGNNAFGGTSCGLESITFESGSQLESIGDYAFWNREKLTSIELPSTLKHIGDKAFEFCYGLTNVSLASGISGLTIGDNAFHRAFRLASFDFAGVVAIGDNAFEDCAALSAVAIPASVETMGANAFARTANLGSQGWFTSEGLTASDVKELSFTVDLTLAQTMDRNWAYGTRSWSGSATFANVTFSDNGKMIVFDDKWLGALNSDGDVIVISYVGTDAEVVMPDKINYNGSDHDVIWSTAIFKDNTTVTKVTLHAAMTEILEDLFNGCSNLVTVVIPDGTTVTKVGDRAFFQATKLADINIDFTELTHIGDYAFSGYRYTMALTGTVKLTSKLTYLGIEAFNRCTNLVIDLSGDALTGITEIGDYAFANTRIVVGSDGILTIPSNIVAIGNGAFNNSRDYLTNDFAPGEGLARVSAVVIDANSELTIGDKAFSSMSFYNAQARYLRLSYVLVLGTPKYVGEMFASNNWYAANKSNRTPIYFADVELTQTEVSGPVSDYPDDWASNWYWLDYNDDEDTITYRPVYGKGSWHYEGSVPTPGAPTESDDANA